jgi:aspartate ammonia-lyase
MKTRKERDSLGELEVPIDAYYGIFTQRASANFKISGIRASRNFIKALGIVKKAAAAANVKLQQLDKKTGEAIIKAATEVEEGKHDKEFVLDVFQAGAGTPFNMNANEVIANRAIELLGGFKGDYKTVHPNNHVNMGQSSNNVVPTALKISLLLQLKPLIKELEKIIVAFENKAKEYENVVKIGRTHLEDAVPIRFGQVFRSYATSLKKSLQKIKNYSNSLLELGIGGTAVGTGITAHPDFQKKTIEELRRTGFDFYPAEDNVELTWSCSSFLELSGGLRILASEMIKIANDLMLLNSGPKAGIAEIALPEVEPGSSIMPGKVNPSIPEAVIMACYQVLGNDAAVASAARHGHLELNVMTPLIAFDLLWSAELLEKTVCMFRTFCVEGIRVDKKRCKELVDQSLSLVTALNPYIGYEVAAELVKISLQENKSLKAVVKEKNIIPDEYLDKILEPKTMTSPIAVDKELQQKVQNNPGFIKFRDSIYK